MALLQKLLSVRNRQRLDNVDLRTNSMVLSNNNELIATGAGAAALGHPAHAIAWLANKLHELWNYIEKR